MRISSFQSLRFRMLLLAALPVSLVGCSGKQSDVPAPIAANQAGQESSSASSSGGMTGEKGRGSDGSAEGGTAGVGKLGIGVEDGPLNPPDILIDPSEATHVQLAEAGAGETPVPIAEPEVTPGSEPAESEPAESEPSSVAMDGNEGQAVEETPAAAIADTEVDELPTTELPNSELPGDDAITGPETLDDWPSPEVVLVVSGQQHGYIEPCGCTGLDRQKGGMMRRATFLKQLRERGWEVVPVDAGNQIQRAGRQSAIKFKTSVKGLELMGYRAIGFGPDDLLIGASELLSVAAIDGDKGSRFTTANVELLSPEFVPAVQSIEAGGRKIGVATALDPSAVTSSGDDSIVIRDMVEKLKASLQQLKDQGNEFNVLLLFGKTEAAKKAAKEVPGFDLIVAADTVGEPTYQPESIEGSESKLIVTGDKGMYLGVIGLFADEPFRYSRVALTSEFEDDSEIQSLMAAYQEQLKSLGLEGLQVNPIAHPSGGEFIGSKACGECHTTAYAIWDGTPHALATEHIVHPGERSEVPRHFDPECLSCHVTGWNPQKFYPYTSGYLSLEKTPLMIGNGCENCHGPGKAHADAEREGSGISAADIQSLREGVTLTLENAREKCLECHDLDNSPDFHLDGAFEDYWSQVEHHGVD